MYCTYLHTNAVLLYIYKKLQSTFTYLLSYNPYNKRGGHYINFAVAKTEDQKG